MNRTSESIKSKIRVLEKIKLGLEARGDLTKYGKILGNWFYEYGRVIALNEPDIARICFKHFLQCSPHGRVPGTFANHIATRLLGIVTKQKLSRKIHGFLDYIERNLALS